MAGVCRIPFSGVQQLEAAGPKSLALSASSVVKMKPNGVDALYVVEKSPPGFAWAFNLPYAPLDSFMPLAQEQLLISRMNPTDR